ncbi:hypothetical protein HPP92_011746 [Vanilla planifolia]|uniref:Uncharacterized protein n=1 Tax=Vanilla planifolia TaxID=51239 RepID=A0A835RC65_VANPL|nr:hypothetical protein HPP92_011746 [Vanilla planifolia]
MGQRRPIAGRFNHGNSPPEVDSPPSPYNGAFQTPDVHEAADSQPARRSRHEGVSLPSSLRKNFIRKTTEESRNQRYVLGRKPGGQEDNDGQGDEENQRRRWRRQGRQHQRQDDECRREHQQQQNRPPPEIPFRHP